MRCLAASPAPIAPSLRQRANSRHARFALVAWLALAACGGSDAPAGPPADPFALPAAPPADPLVVDAALDVFASATQPDAALDALQREIRAVYDNTANPLSASRAVRRSLLEAAIESNDLAALQAAFENAGNVFEIPSNAGDPLAPEGGLCGASSDGESTIVYYINGVFTAPWEALNTKESLRALMLGQFPADAADMNFRLYYNRSGLRPDSLSSRVCNALDGGLESAAQSCSVTWIPLCAVLNAAELINDWLRLRDLCLATGHLPDFIQSVNQWLNVLSGTLIPSPLSQLETEQFAAAIGQDVLSGKKVIVVAHSQGNFFTEAALGLLPAFVRDSVGVVAIAPPTDYSNAGTFGYFDYSLLENDIIRCIPFTLLPPNVDNAVSRNASCMCCDDGKLVHSIDDSYLGWPQTRWQIASQIRAAYLGTSNGDPSAGQGFVQFTASWNIAGDIDLHVYEPTGEHVYFGDRSGDFGTLDRDDITGTGPENYYICTQPQVGVGDYDIWIHNYGGAPGTQVSLAVKAGAQVRSYTITVGASSPTSTPSIFVTTVRYDGNGFSFEP